MAMNSYNKIQILPLAADITGNQTNKKINMSTLT